MRIRFSRYNQSRIHFKKQIALPRKWKNVEYAPVHLTVSSPFGLLSFPPLSLSLVSASLPPSELVLIPVPPAALPLSVPGWNFSLPIRVDMNWHRRSLTSACQSVSAMRSSSVVVAVVRWWIRCRRRDLYSDTEDVRCQKEEEPRRRWGCLLLLLLLRKRGDEDWRPDDLESERRKGCGWWDMAAE